MWNERKRFNVVCCGRRWGKTHFGEYVGARYVLPGPSGGQPFAWFAPTYRMLSEVWRDWNWRLNAAIRDRSVQERRLEFHGGGSVDFWSLDNPDAPRGRKYAVIVVDEAALVPNLNDTFERVLRPMLVDLVGSAWLFSTPRGFDGFNALFNKRDHDERGEWASWQMPSMLNPYMRAEEWDAIRSDCDPLVWSQEYEAQFRSRAGLVYFQFSRHGNIDATLKDNETEIRIGMDFNVNPMSAVVWVRAADEMHVLDTIELNNSGTEEMAQVIRDRYPKRQVIVYPDPSGDSRRSSAPVGQTDFTILRRYGFRVVAPNAAPPVVDRVNETNRMLCDANGRRRLLIHPRCKRLITCFEQLAYKDGTSIVDKKDNLDHLPDGVGYSVHMEFPIAGKGGTFRVHGA